MKRTDVRVAVKAVENLRKSPPNFLAVRIVNFCEISSNLLYDLRFFLQSQRDLT